MTSVNKDFQFMPKAKRNTKQFITDPSKFAVNMNSKRPKPYELVKKKFSEEFNSPSCEFVDKYEIMAKIGQGSYGEVFKAKLRSDPSKLVALKRVLANIELDGFPITTIREIRILKLFKHRNIINLIEFCRDKPTHSKGSSSLFLVLEFCEHDLMGLLSNSNVKFNLAEIKCVVKQILNGLYFIHFNKVLHRDLKSSNILITKNGEVKLADFGLARATYTCGKKRPRRFTNKVVSLWYRPPELLLGARMYDSAIDMWGVGCIMAEMWLRTPLMRGYTEQHQLFLISHLCGSITTKVWPSVQSLRLFDKICLPMGQKRKVKEQLFPYLKNRFACDLVNKLLVLDPSKRIDADTALNHDFFWTDPMPGDLKNMMSQFKRSMFEYFAPQKHDNKHLLKSNLQSTPKKQKFSQFEDEYVERIY